MGGAYAPERRAALPALVDYAQTRPDFLSFRVDDLPHAGPHLFRAALAKPVMSWTIRTPAQRARAALWADQMVFMGPPPNFGHMTAFSFRSLSPLRDIAPEDWLRQSEIRLPASDLAMSLF